MTSVHLDLTILVVSHFSSAKVSLGWLLNPGFGTQKKCDPSKEVIKTKIM